MKRRIAIGVAIGVSLLVAGCAQVQPRQVCGTQCTVTITVVNGTPCAVADPDYLEVRKPGAVIHFQLATPGYHFGPGKGIVVKSDPHHEFEHLPAQSNRTKVTYRDHYRDGAAEYPYSIDIDPDAGGAHCHVDPIIANG